jgi:hypothetical protein
VTPGALHPLRVLSPIEQIRVVVIWLLNVAIGEGEAPLAATVRPFDLSCPSANPVRGKPIAASNPDPLFLSVL